MKPNQCKGCGIGCFIHLYIDEAGITCPCSTCILKVMCSYQCPDRAALYAEINSYLQDKRSFINESSKRNV